MLLRRYRYPAGPALGSPSADRRSGDPAGTSLNARSFVAVIHPPSKQRICVTSHIALYAATGTWGGSLESGTTVHSAPETFAQIVKSSRTTTALTLSSCSRLRLIGRHSSGFFPCLVYKFTLTLSSLPNRGNPDSLPPVLHDNIYYPKHE
jgi:hypothetical protein